MRDGQPRCAGRVPAEGAAQSRGSACAAAPPPACLGACAGRPASPSPSPHAGRQRRVHGARAGCRGRGEGQRSPPLRRENARSPGLGCAEGRTAAGGARGCGCPEMGCASSRLCLYPQCAAARVTLPGGSSRWAALGSGGVGVGSSLFSFFLFFPRPGAAGRAAAASVCYCEPLTHLAGGSRSAWQSLGVVLVVFSLRKLQIFILVHASFTVLRCPCQQSLGLCCKVMLLHPS